MSEVHNIAPQAEAGDSQTQARAQAQEPKGCRWIDGDPRDRDWCYCQAPVEKAGGSWCQEHEARVFGWVAAKAA